MPLRVLIVDDELLIRHMLRGIIERHQGWTICGEAGDGIEAISKASELDPDLILLDVSMPNLDGLTALPRLKERNPRAGVLILTLHESLDLARMSATAGAWGYVAKSMASSDLVPAIESYEATVSPQ